MLSMLLLKLFVFCEDAARPRRTRGEGLVEKIDDHPRLLKGRHAEGRSLSSPPHTSLLIYPSLLKKGQTRANTSLPTRLPPPTSFSPSSALSRPILPPHLPFVFLIPTRP